MFNHKLNNKMLSLNINNSKMNLKNISCLTFNITIKNTYINIIRGSKLFIYKKLNNDRTINIFNQYNSNVIICNNNINTLTNIKYFNYSNSLKTIDQQSLFTNAIRYENISRLCYQNNGNIFWNNKLKNSIYIVSADYTTTALSSTFSSYLQNKITNLNFNTLRINVDTIVSGYFNRYNY